MELNPLQLCFILFRFIGVSLLSIHERESTLVLWEDHVVTLLPKEKCTKLVSTIVRERKTEK